MYILFTDNLSGFARRVQVEPGTTLVNFLQHNTAPGTRPDDFTLRVNRQIEEQSYMLREGDRITLTPAKVSGGV